MPGMSVEGSNLDISKVLTPLSLKQIKTLNKEELAVLLQGEQNIRLQFQSFYNEAKAVNEELRDKKLLIEEQFVVLKNKFFGKSSERRKIAPQPKPNPPPKKRGRNGFGFDFVFVPNGYKKTYSQLSKSEKNKISHRALALKKLKKYLG